MRFRDSRIKPMLKLLGITEYYDNRNLYKKVTSREYWHVHDIQTSDTITISPRTSFELFVKRLVAYNKKREAHDPNKEEWGL